MNIYEKITKAKKEILEANLKKSGENKFAGFKYYELADITPKIIEICDKLKLHTKISFDIEYATLEITNIENIEEKLFYTSPMKELSLKGCNDIQALGGTETYQRRYLYMMAFDIIENDMFDATSGNETQEEKKATEKQITILEEKCTDEEIEMIYKKYKIDKLEDLSMEIASKLISRKLGNG